MPDTKKYISKITLPGGTTYEIKDLEARSSIEELQRIGLKFVISTDAASTPYGVEWYSGTTKITGTLVASADIHSIYLVPDKETPDGSSTQPSAYKEFVCVQSGNNYIWELLGNTDVTINNLGALAYKDSISVTKGDGDMVLGESTTFTNASSAVTFTGGTSDTFVKSYPGVTTKLETTSIKGVGADITFDAVGTATDYTATNTVFGTDTTASKIVTESKTATNTVFDTDTTASKATAGTAVALAKAAATATNVSYVGDGSTSSILGSMSVNESTETLSFATAAVTQASVTGTNGTETITPYSFTDVTVPVVSSNSSVAIASVKTNTDVTVPVVSSNTAYTMTKITTASKTAATSAANATTVATGGTASNDTVGATIMTGLGTATTASAVTGVGTGTAAAQTITVGTNDKIKVIKYDDLSVSAV